MNQARHPQSFPANHQTVLSFKGQSFAAQEIVDVAWFLGQLQPAWERFRSDSTAAQHAANLNLECDGDLLQQMSENFRYERDLLTTEETERWLALRDISEEEFGDYFSRRYWGEHGFDAVQAELLDYPDASADLRKNFRGDLFLSREFDRLSRAWSWRLVSEAESVTNEQKDVERQRILLRLGLTERQLSLALDQLGRSADWLDHLLRREVSFQLACARVLQPAERLRLLPSMSVALTRVEIESFAPHSRDAAEEAFVCLKEGSASMDEMAAECGSHCELQRMFLGDCPEDLQATLLSASVDQVLPLQDLEGGFIIARIRGKTQPRLEDDEVRQRIDDKLLELFFVQAANHSLCWTPGWEPAC